MFKLKWGQPGLGRSLEPEEILDLRKRLIKAAIDSRVFHIQLLPAEITWINDNIDNANLKQVTSDTEDDKTWCILGVDKESVEYEYSKI